MEVGLLRNSSGKVYQTVKAYITGLSVDYRDPSLKIFSRKEETVRE
ncbi:hypothetical protein [Sulfurisphaera javensis]